MLACLAKKNPSQVNSFVTVGYLMMGKHTLWNSVFRGRINWWLIYTLGIGMGLVLVDVPVGNLICRVSKTERYEFSQSVDTFALDFISLLLAA